MSSAKTLTVLITTLTLLLYAGCRKKTVEQTEPASETAQQQPTKSQAQKPIPEAQNERPNMPPAAAPPAAVEQTNQPAQVQQQQKISSAPIKRPEKTAPSAADITGKTELQEPTNLNQFASLKSPEEKTDWISEFSDANPDQIAAMAEMAMSDANTEVRTAALDAVIENETPALAAIAKAMTDGDEEVREKAVEASQFIDDEQAGDILIKAINDQSELVREMAMETADEKNVDTKLSVYKTAITSKYDDVKNAAVDALVDMSNKQAVPILIEGLKDPNPDFRDDIPPALDFLIGQEFKTYDEAIRWWNQNQNKFDDELNELDE